MKAEVSGDKLKKAIAQAERITSKNLSLPVLSSIYIEIVPQNIIIRSTNLDLGFEAVVPARVSKTGVAVLPGVTVAGALSTISPGQTVKMEGVNKNITLSFGGSSVLIKSQNQEEFPKIPKVSGGEELKIPANELIEGARAVSYAASVSDIKPEIASVYLFTEDGEMVFVATDSFRLAEKKVAHKTKNKFQVIIPHRNATEIIKAFEGANGELSLLADKNQISIQGEDGTRLVSRLINGVFPDYRMVIPTQQTTKITLNKEELLNSLKLSNIFSGKLNRANLKYYSKDGVVEIESKDESVGEGVARPKADASGEDVDVVFNARYLIDCMQAIPGNRVQMSFDGPTKPIVVRGLGDDTFLYLVMPMAH